MSTETTAEYYVGTDPSLVCTGIAVITHDKITDKLKYHRVGCIKPNNKKTKPQFKELQLAHKLRYIYEHIAIEKTLGRSNQQ